MDNSPPIFPHVQYSNMGITLRDLWATIAMAIRTQQNGYGGWETADDKVTIASHSYELADAMMAVRKTD